MGKGRFFLYFCSHPNVKFNVLVLIGNMCVEFDRNIYSKKESLYVLTVHLIADYLLFFYERDAMLNVRTKTQKYILDTIFAYCIQY